MFSGNKFVRHNNVDAYERDEVVNSDSLRLSSRYANGPNELYRLVEAESVGEFGLTTWESVGAIIVPVNENIELVQSKSGNAHWSKCRHARGKLHSQGRFYYCGAHLRKWSHKLCDCCIEDIREKLIGEFEDDQLQGPWEWDIDSEHCDICGLAEREIRNGEIGACYYCGGILADQGFSQIDPR